MKGKGSSKFAETGLSYGPDYWLLTIVVILLIFGLLMVFSASSALSYSTYQRSTYYLERQILWVLLGAVALYVFSRLDYHLWQGWAVAVIAVTLLALAAVLIVNRGSGEGEAARWLFSRSVQPGEFAKLAIVIYIGAWLASKGDKIRQLTYGLVPFSILLGVTTGLIIVQPNLSTAVLIATTAIIMFFVAGADILQLLIFAVIGGASLVTVVKRSEYQMQRVAGFLSDPLADPFGQGYQAFHSLMALISGGLGGVGLGGSRHKMDFRAVSHTDVILAVIGEELGLIGTLLVLGLFVAFAYRGIRIAMQSPDSFGCFLAVGITSWILLQAAVHVGVVTKTVPFTGMPLPFISYGGSALVVEMAGVGLLLGVSKRVKVESDIGHADLALRRRDGWARLSGTHGS